MQDIYISVHCDNCQKSLETRTLTKQNRLVLRPEMIAEYADCHYNPNVDPMCVDNRNHHFCNLQCLKEWLDRKLTTGPSWRTFVQSTDPKREQT